MSFSVVVVLHDSRDELATLLASMPAAPELIVVDTGGDDGGAQLAREHGATVIERRDNPGFGAANNAGMTHVTTGVTILLNPDTELLDRDTLETLAQLARDHPDALHVPRLLNPDGSVQRSAHPLPGTLGAFVPAAIHPPLLPRTIRERAEPHRATTPRTVGWAIAACLAAATPTLRRLGPFDPAIHLFAEDMDLGLRARALGVPTVLHPELALRHTGGHAVQRGGEPYALLARRRRETVERTRGVTARTLDDAAQALTFTTRIAARAALGRDASRERAQLAALRAAARPLDSLQ